MDQLTVSDNDNKEVKEKEIIEKRKPIISIEELPEELPVTVSDNRSRSDNFLFKYISKIKQLPDIIINKEDVDTVRKGKKLKDTIVEFFLRYFLSNTPNAEDYFVFDTDFYRVISKEKCESERKISGFTKNYNLNNYKYIIVPILSE